MPSYDKSAASMDFKSSDRPNEAQQAKLMSTTAKDRADNMTATNSTDQHIGKGGAPKGPFGKKGREF